MLARCAGLPSIINNTFRLTITATTTTANDIDSDGGNNGNYNSTTMAANNCQQCDKPRRGIVCA